MDKPRVMIFIDWFLPGYKAGGPIRSVANLVETLHHQYAFSIVTTDRDLGDSEPYPGIETETWIEHEHYRVWYASPTHQSYRHLRNLVFNNEFDLLYTQSMFSLKYTLFPLWTCRALRPEAKMVLAPRGMLHEGALGLKSRKKKLFLRVFKFLRLHKAVVFQATDTQEEADIRKWLGEVEVEQVKNLPRAVLPPAAAIEKVSGALRMVFFSRVSVKKGVHRVLEDLQRLGELEGADSRVSNPRVSKSRDSESKEANPEVSEANPEVSEANRGRKVRIEFDIYGAQDEPEYWTRLEQMILTLPDHITVSYRGTVPPEETAATLQQYHLFVMPTLGENFGHAIFESLAAGRPVLISDQTPWQGLAAQKAGWEFPLQDADSFVRTISQVAEMDQNEWNVYSKGARQMAANYIEGLDAEAAYATLFSPPKNL